MNYIKEINAFYDQIVFNPLSGSAQAVWHTLMHFNNKSGWQPKFTVPASLIEITSGVKGTTFKRARTELVDKGYISVTPGSGNQAATYRMISQIKLFPAYTDTDQQDTSAAAGTNAAIASQQTSPEHFKPVRTTAQPAAVEPVNLQIASHNPDDSSDHTTNDPASAPDKINTAKHRQTDQSPDDPACISKHSMARISDHNTADNMDHNTVHNPVRSMDHNPARNPVHSLDHNAAPLTKQYINKTETKQNIITITTTDFYQQHFGIPSPYITQDIEHWISDMDDTLVLNAMKRALEQNKPKWGYVKGILKSWQTKGIKTIEEAAADDDAFRNRHTKKANHHHRDKAEVIPEWFQEQKQKQALQEQQTRRQTRTAYSQKESEEFDQLLAAFTHRELNVSV